MPMVVFNGEKDDDFNEYNPFILFLILILLILTQNVLSDKDDDHKKDYKDKRKMFKTLPAEPVKAEAKAVSGGN
ncbi:hypothetical protein [Halothermothrix orenii]|uniref:hypothetical protein n=1 Tax=Halothermothrix orenii TaxID=31909 RepID=UPI00031548FC|nr:hypothetical protein [Halothermothrix orenii]